MTTLTTACPVTLWPAYVQLRRCIAPDQHTADNPPEDTPAWQRDGTEYVASSMPRQPWVLAALEPLSEPEWGADMDLAQQAQAALVVWPAPGLGPEDDPGDPPLAQPDKITVIVGPSGMEALAAMGLEQVETEGAI